MTKQSNPEYFSLLHYQSSTEIAASKKRIIRNSQTSYWLNYFRIISCIKADKLPAIPLYLSILTIFIIGAITPATATPTGLITAGPYSVNFTGVTYSNNTSQYSYTVQRTGAPQGNGLSHIIFSLGTCLKFTDVKSATIDGKAYTNLASSEGGGTGCNVAGSILKFDNLPEGPSDGNVHTFTFTVSGIMEVTSATTWVKAGPSCYAAPIPGPGCIRKCTLKLELNKSDITCFGDQNGRIIALAADGKGPLEYSINGQTYQSGNVFSNLAPGEYSISVREKELTSCIATKKVVIEQPAVLALAISYAPIKCYNDKTILTITASGGNAAYQYSINGGSTYQNTNEFEVAAGQYEVYIKDKNNCVANKTVIIDQPKEIQFTTNYTAIKCYGSTTTLTINANGGTGNFEYSINNGANYQQSNLFANVAAGNYTVSVKDANRCVQYQTITIQQPELIKVKSSINPITCHGDKTTVRVEATGGTGLLMYSLNEGTYQTSVEFQNLTAGSYTICVKDASGCITCEKIEISEPEQLSLNISSDPIKCYGDKTTLTANANGGNDGYVYTINNGAYTSANTFDNLLAGEYILCVKDQKGCITCQTVTIRQPEKLEIASAFEPVTCFGSTTRLSVSAKGGTGPLEYSITNGASFQASNTFEGLTAGNYNVCAKDKNGCTSCETVVIEQPAKLQISTVYSPIKCFGDKSTLTATANGGSAPYQYAINNGTYSSDNTFENLTAGRYTVCVKDKSGCVQCEEIQMTQPTSLQVSTSYLPIVCRGDKTTLTVTANGGTAPYEYSINGGTTYISSNVFANLASGDYNVCVKDKNGCIKCIVVCIAAPPAFSIKTVYLPIKCYGDKTTLTVTASGGTGVLLYSLNGGTYQTSNVFSNILAGTYTVRIKDQNECSKSVQVTVVQPKQITISTSYPAILCYGSKTSLTVTASNGTAPYLYSINGGTYGSSNVFKDLRAGNYTVMVKDAKGCVQTKQVCLTEPKLIVLKYSYPAIPCAGGKTTLTITASGGTGTLLYSINGGTYQSSNVFKNLPAGCYNVCVKDSKGCVQCQSITIDSYQATNSVSAPLARMAVSPQEAALPENILAVYPNPYIDKTAVEFSLMESSNYTLVVYDTKGKAVKQLSTGKANAGQLYQFELDGSLPTGIYMVTLTTDQFKKTFKISRQ